MNIKTKKQVQVEQQILYNLTQIIEICPQYTIAQHMIHILRPKGDAKKDVYGWSDELTLKKVEEYYDELREDLLAVTNEED